MVDITILYDRSCPICNAYVRYNRLKKTADDNFKLLDARESAELVNKLYHQGMDINLGMVLIIGTSIYHGSECLNMLAMMSDKSDSFNRLNAIIFSNKISAWLFYPILKFGRRIVLSLLGIPMIQIIDPTNEKDSDN